MELTKTTELTKNTELTTKTILLNKKEYTVFQNEFELITIPGYETLKIHKNLGQLERLSGFCKELSQCLADNSPSIYIESNNCGGFLALQLNEIYSVHVNENVSTSNHLNNLKNFKNLKKTYVITNHELLETSVVLLNEIPEDRQEFYYLTQNRLPVIISPKEDLFLNSLYSCKYTLDYPDFHKNGDFITNPNPGNFNLYFDVYTVYVPDNINQKFLEVFQCYLKGNILKYDNLIHLTMIVKNAGPMFEEVLTKNLPYFDRWTILDTGSTDNTIEIIQKVLIGKKNGKLYQEPFINFRESRNRCLELAGNQIDTCKYSLMLDDTYIIEGYLRNFLYLTRGDQFSDSFSLFIKSDDMEYASNRITKFESKLKYIHTLHEVIQDYDNVCVCIYLNDSWIFDKRSDYMENRTMDRKQYDLDRLFEMLEKDPNDSRQLYYIAQTYSLLGGYHRKLAEDKEKLILHDAHRTEALIQRNKSLEYKRLAYTYFIKRATHPNPGFYQEIVDSYFEAARIQNFDFQAPWEVCLELYNKSFETDPKRPDSLYFIGIHYMKEDRQKAYNFFKKAFLLGYPEHSQHSLKPTLYYHYLLIYFIPLCFEFKDYVTGEQACDVFLNCGRNKVDSEYEVIVNWKKAFVNLNSKIVQLKFTEPCQKVLCIVADGNWNPWTGRDILTKGLGGSETFIVEIARYIKSYRVIVFCRCSSQEFFENVEYRSIEEYSTFVKTNLVDTVLVSRYYEYLFVALTNNVKNVYLVLHDIVIPNNIIPITENLKGVLCLSDWHRRQFVNYFPLLEKRTVTFNYGIDTKLFASTTEKKIPYKFIFSSFPNRGLLPLLQMWPAIKFRYPLATLEVFCDVYNEFSNRNFPDYMNLVNKLLVDYSAQDLGITVRGFCPKDVLVKGWLSSEIWFYPCHFEETFCLTAYEAQLSKTLVITTNLAALNETVSDRGVLIPVQKSTDPLNQEWQDKALQTVYEYLDNKEKRFAMTEYAYSFVKDRSWESRSRDFENLIWLKN